MKEKSYELKITPKVEKWIDKIATNDIVFENIITFLIRELETNPYPRYDNPTLIKPIRGLKRKNPAFWRIKIKKELGLKKEYRLFYSIKETEMNNYVVAVDFSDIDDNSKTQTVERLKKITLAKFEDIICEEILEE